MSASTVSITTSKRNSLVFQFPVAAAIKTLKGCLAALDGSNNLVNAADAASRRVVGVHYAETDNSAGSAGDLNSDVEVGCFLFTNGSNALTDAHIGQACFVEDNQTVGSSAGTNGVVAGIVAKVNTDGVWVHVGLPAARLAPVAVTLTSTNGTAAAASASLANLAAEAEKIGDDVRAIHAALITAGLVK